MNRQLHGIVNEGFNWRVAIFHVNPGSQQIITASIRTSKASRDFE